MSIEVTPPMHGRWRALSWRMFLVAAPLFAGAYLLLPTTGSARTIAYPAFGLIATAAILASVRWGRPERPRSWRMIAIGLALLSVGDITYSALVLMGGEIPYPSLADVGYLCGYSFVALGVAGLTRGRMSGGDRMPVIDGAILASGASSIFWLV